MYPRHFHRKCKKKSRDRSSVVKEFQKGAQKSSKKGVLHTEFNVIVLVESGGVVTITAYKATTQGRLPDQVINLSCVSVESKVLEDPKALDPEYRDIY